MNYIVIISFVSKTQVSEQACGGDNIGISARVHKQACGGDNIGISAGVQKQACGGDSQGKRVSSFTHLGSQSSSVS